MRCSFTWEALTLPAKIALNVNGKAATVNVDDAQIVRDLSGQCTGKPRGAAVRDVAIDEAGSGLVTPRIHALAIGRMGAGLLHIDDAMLDKMQAEIRQQDEQREQARPPQLAEPRQHADGRRAPYRRGSIDPAQLALETDQRTAHDGGDQT